MTITRGTEVHHRVRISAVVTAGQEILVVRRPTCLWELPGGTLPVGKSIPDAVRELVARDTGALVTVMGVTGIYPRNLPRLTSSAEPCRLEGL